MNNNFVSNAIINAYLVYIIMNVMYVSMNKMRKGLIVIVRMDISTKLEIYYAQNVRINAYYVKINLSVLNVLRMALVLLIVIVTKDISENRDMNKNAKFVIINVKVV